MKSHRLIPILSIVMSCTSVALYSSEVADVSEVNDNKRVIEAPTNELYKALQESNVPRAIRVLTNIKKRERLGFIGAACANAGILRGIRLGLGGITTGFSAGHLFNRVRPIPQPVRPQPVVANTVTNHAISVAAGVAGVGAGAAAGAGVATAGVTVSSWIAAEAAGTAVGAPGVATVVTAATALGAVAGGIGGCTIAHAVQNTTAAAHNARAMATYDHQVAQAQSHTYSRLSSAVLAGAAGATLAILGPSLHRIARIPGSMHECCQYKHDGHNLWSIAFEMTDDNLMRFSRTFLDYNPARDLMNEPMKNGMYPIHAAIQRGNHDLVELLVRKNVIATRKDSNITIRSCYSLDQQDVEGNTALFYAIGEGYAAIASTLLTPHEETKLYADSNIPNRSGLAPLHIAVEQERVDLIQLLVAEGARIQCRIPSTGITPLHIAAQQGYADCAEYLLRLDESDIDTDHKNERDSSLVNMQDNQGNTPLLRAAQQGHYSVVRTLLDRPNKTGADPFLANYQGITPLMAACKIGKEDIVAKLIQIIPSNNRKRFVDQRDDQDRNALHHILQSISQNKVLIIEELRDVKIEVDQKAITLADELSNERQEVLQLLQVSGN